MIITFVFVLSIWTVPFSVCLWPDEQPGCLFRPEANLFYAYNGNLGPNLKNWLCENETFEERLKICIDVYQRTTQGKVETSYEIVKDKDSVSRECKKRNMTFTQEFEPGEPEFDTLNITIRNHTIEVNMFACPITKMDLRFPVPYLKPELYDIYISLGRNDITIAALTDSRYLDNICVRNVYLYPPKHLRPDKPRTRPFYPDEIRDYGFMKNEEYFNKLANKLYARKMATATGADFDYWSTVLYNVTIKPTTETAGTASSDAETPKTSAQSADPAAASGVGSLEDIFKDDRSSEETSTDDGSSEETSTDDGSSEEISKDGGSSEETDASPEDGTRETETLTEPTSEKVSTAIDRVIPENVETVIPETTTMGNTDTAHSLGTTLKETKASKKAVSRKAKVVKPKKASKKSNVTKSRKSSKKAKASKSETNKSKKAKVTKSRKKATKKLSSTTLA